MLHLVVHTAPKRESLSVFARSRRDVQTDQVEVAEPGAGQRHEDPNSVSRDSNPTKNGASRDPMIGQLVLSRYRVVKPLAHGGMGVVYLGRTEGAAGFSRPVVIKRVLPELLTDPNIGKMFVREARILANLNHTGIVGVVDFGQEDGAYVMVLDYVHGYDTNQWVTYLRRKQRSVPQDIALQIVIRVLEALHYAHTLKRADGTLTQVVHRDISPSNILLDAEGNVRLLDFGIARIANAANEYRTQETTFKGKLGYAHPSLIAKGEPSAQTDVYSAAVVLFQLLSGVNPFRGANPADTLQRVIRAPLPKLRSSVPSASAELEAVLLRGMSRDLTQGFQTAAEMAEALRALRSGSETALNAQMGEILHADFYGDLPVVLDLEPLDQRDAAWRSFTFGEPGILRSTPPRPVEIEEPTRIRRTTGSDDNTLVAPSESSPGQVAAVHPESAKATAYTAGTSIPPGARRRAWPWVLVSAALSLGVVFIATSAFDDADESHAGQVPGTVAQAGVGAASLAAQSSAAPSTTIEIPASATQAAAAPTLGPLPTTPVKPDLDVLSRRFAEREAAIQACFEQQPPSSKEPTLGLQVSLSLDKGGVPTAVHLVPATLEKSGFGHCVLDLASQVRFGALTDAVTFRVPIRRTP